MDILAIGRLLSYAPQIATWVSQGVSVVDALTKKDGSVVPILAGIGKQLFPNLRETIDPIEAAANTLFNPHGMKWVQEQLNNLTKAKLEADGAFGALTKAAVIGFQQTHQPDAGPVDGYPGPRTIAAIEKAASEAAKHVPQ